MSIKPKRNTDRRVQASSSIDKYLIATLNELSIETRIPKSKLYDEALELLFQKYNKTMVTDTIEK